MSSDLLDRLSGKRIDGTSVLQTMSEAADEIAALRSRLDGALGMLREIEFFLRGHPGEASVLRAKVQKVIDGAVERLAPIAGLPEPERCLGHISETVQCMRLVGHAGDCGLQCPYEDHACTYPDTRKCVCKP